MQINTKSYKLKDINSKLADTIASKYEVDGEIELIRKGIPLDSKSSVEEDSETGLMYISTKHTDRDKDIVLPTGAILDEYRLTPVVLWCHKYSMDDVPVGKNLWIKQDKEGLIAKTKFHTRPNTIGEKVYNYLKDGFPLACSIGFVPLKWIDKEDFDTIDTKSLGIDKDDLSNANRVFTKWVLLEYSMVPVASNAQSTVIDIKDSAINIGEDQYFYIPESFVPDEKELNDGNEEKAEETEQEEKGTASGCDREEQKEIEYEIEIVTKPDTPNLIHIPAKGQEGKHSGHKIRTITISSSRGIKAHYCIPDKVITGYMFDTSKWTHEEATQWVRDHSKHFDDNAENIVKFIDENDGKEIEFYCECEEPDFEDDECKGCGGRRKPRKPKKEVEEIDDVGFGEVMGEEPNPVKLDSLEVEITINKEHFDNFMLIIDSLNQKVLSLEARLMDIQKATEEKIVEEEVEVKAGRILSKRTLGIIQRAIDALNELITLADKPKEDDDDEEDEEEEDEKSISITDLSIAKEEKPSFDEAEVSSVVKEVLNDVFSKYSIDAKEILNEALKRKQGRMF